jgi:hypothetical protein
MPGAIARNIFRVTATELRNARFAPKKIGFIARAHPARPMPQDARGGLSSRAAARPPKGRGSLARSRRGPLGGSRRPLRMLLPARVQGQVGGCPQAVLRHPADASGSRRPFARCHDCLSAGWSSAGCRMRSSWWRAVLRPGATLVPRERVERLFSRTVGVCRRNDRIHERAFVSGWRTGRLSWRAVVVC